MPASTQRSQEVFILAPQPTVGTPGTPVRFTTSNVYCKSFQVEAKTTNAGVVRIAPTEALASTTNSSELKAGTVQIYEADDPGGQDAFFNLNDMWIDGTESGDLVVVQYIQSTTSIQAGIE